MAVFLQVTGKEPILYRLMISSETGKIIKEERIPKVEANARGGDKPARHAKIGNTYYVKKDPKSDAYAVVFYQREDLDKFAKMVLIHYNGSGQEIQRSYILAPSQHQYNDDIHYCDMAVNGTTEVYLGCYVFNTRRKPVSSAIMLSHIHGNKVDQTLMTNAPVDAASYASVCYNKSAGLVDVLIGEALSIKTQAGANNSITTITYGSKLVALNASNLSVKYTKGLDNRPSTAYRKTVLKGDDEFNGAPKGLIVNDDGTTTIVSEDEVHSRTYDAAITEYDGQGMAINACVFKKGNQFSAGLDVLGQIRQGNLSAGEGTLKQAMMGKSPNAGYSSYESFHAGPSHYFMFNDADVTRGRPEQGVSNTNTVAYNVSDKSTNPIFPFGEPGDDFDNRFADYFSGDYSEASGQYSVMIVERRGRKKQARIAWVSFK